MASETENNEKLKIVERSASQVERGDAPDIEYTEEMRDGEIRRDEFRANSESNRELRKKYADNVFYYLVAYSIAVFSLLVLYGFGIYEFALPENVLLALVGSTAASSIGLVGFVVKGLFTNQ